MRCRSKHPVWPRRRPTARRVRKGFIYLASALTLAGTSVPVFSLAKTVAGLFRYRRTVVDALAVEGLWQALRQRKATPAELTREAEAGGAWAMM